MRTESEIRKALKANEEEHARLEEELSHAKIFNGSYLDDMDKYINTVTKVDENLYFVDCEQTSDEFLDAFARAFSYAVMLGQDCRYEVFVPLGTSRYTFYAFIEIIPDGIKKMKSGSLHPNSKFRTYNYAFRVDTRPEKNEQIYYDDEDYDSTKKIYYEDERQKECSDAIMNAFYPGKKLDPTVYRTIWNNGKRLYTVRDETMKLEQMPPSKLLRKIIKEKNNQ